MSDIKIQPSATGSATVTLTAPVTNTARTITFPDSTSTLLASDGSAANLTSIPAANITGTLPAISGASLTNLPADATKLPLAGGTMTGALVVTAASGITVNNNASSNTDPSLILTGASNASQDSYMQMGAMFTSNPLAMGMDNSSNLFKISRNSSGNISSGEHLVINSSGVVSVPNGIELGSGIDATAANTLDDYEEGNFTPVFTGTSGSAGSFNTGEWEGRYTKIGRLVTCIWKTTLSDRGSWAGEVRFTGLPFTPNWTVPGAGSVGLRKVNYAGGSVGSVNTYVTNGQTYWGVVYSQDNDVHSWVQVTDCHDDAGFWGVITYVTA